MYKVIKDFIDKKDNDHLYKEGEAYPREGYEASAERIDFLISDKNLTGSPVITEVHRGRRKKDDVD